MLSLSPFLSPTCHNTHTLLTHDLDANPRLGTLRQWPSRKQRWAGISIRLGKVTQPCTSTGRMFADRLEECPMDS